MSFDNRITADQLAALEPGDTVVFEIRVSYGSYAMQTGTVAKLTPTQVVVHYQGANDRSIETRYRLKDGRAIGGQYGDSLLDPTHPRTTEGWRRTQQQNRQRGIDSLAHRWARERDNLDLLRQLQVAISEYLDAEERA